MARPLRINLVDGWYHITARGIERRDIFRDDRDRIHFQELLAEMAERFRMRLHAYVLMNNHYHLLIQTPQANASRALQWLNVSHGVWFNRRHHRSGPLFQGRFKSVPVEGQGAWALELSVYIHLNPVRVKGLGLGKAERQAEKRGLSLTPEPALVTERLRALRHHRWSSYGVYAGYLTRPIWLTCQALWERVRPSGIGETTAYRQFIEERLKQGLSEGWPERMSAALAIGSATFQARLRQWAIGNRQEQSAVRAWERWLPFGRVKTAVAAEKGERWEHFRDRRGDWGRDLAWWIGRRHCGLTLGELGEEAGGVADRAVGIAIARMDGRLAADRELRKIASRIVAGIKEETHD
jgi:REP element-mobilizing transposase RayT